MTPRKVRILCVDDSAETRRLFELVLLEHPEFQTVGLLTGTEELEETIATVMPDVVVMDLSMPGRDPLAAMRCALGRFPGVRFLISSAYDEPAGVAEAFAAGATGYLVKEGVLQELVDALRKVANGEEVVPRQRGPGKFGAKY